jgi:hypothetical protein
LSRSIFALALIGALISCGPHAVFAQDKPQNPWSFSLEGGAALQSDTDLKEEDGEFSVDRTFIAANLDYSWNPRQSVGVSIGSGRTDYDFAWLEPEDPAPWDKIEDFRASVSTRFAAGETGTVFLIPTVRYNGEKNARSSDSRTWGLYAAAAWRLSEDLTIGPGLGVFSRLEDGARVFPFLVIDWNIGERWNLSTGRGLAASQGPGLTLSYQVSPSWSLGVAGRYERVEFRLDEEGPVPGGVGEDQSFPLVFTTSWSPGPAVSLSLFAGIEFAGELKLKDSDGELLSQSEYDAAAIYGATFEFSF